MDRLEMARELFNNPKLKARNERGGIVCVKCGDDIDYSKNDKYLKWLHSGYVDMCIVKNETWEIIEPKLKEFCYGEMVYVWILDDVDIRKIKSCVSGLSYERSISTISCGELMGKWTIEGYYEGDEDDKE